jgi:hypothetical protein
MTGPTQPLSDYSADTRIMSRCARGYDWNYIASGETFTTAAGATYNTTLATAGASGGAIKHNQTINASLVDTTAIYGNVAFGTAGRVTGLAAGVTGEVLLSAYTTQGTYAALEGELGAGSGASTGAKTTFLYCNGYGADVATTIDTLAAFLYLGPGLTAGSGCFIDTAITSGTHYGGLRVFIPGVGTRWIALVSA